MEFFPRPTRVEQMSYEVSEEYFTTRDSPYSASNLLKSAKILIVLEDPVKRAFYHYQVGLIFCALSGYDCRKPNTKVKYSGICQSHKKCAELIST
jgi:hypothetical protein